jgi:hypothetical protein
MWWKELVNWLEYPHTWSIGLAITILWVVTAYVFTVIDWFYGNLEESAFGDQAMGSLWVWVLPVVVGWLLVSPKCNEDRLRVAMERANFLAHVATDTHTTPARHLPEKCFAISLDFDAHDELRVDETNTAPIYNFSRFLSWVQSVEEVLRAFEAASQRRQQHESVDPGQDWVVVQPNEQPHPENRLGNRAQVERYCTQDDLEVPGTEDTRRGRWGPNVLSRMLVSSFLALFLQWGTTGAAISFAYNTPTTGELSSLGLVDIVLKTDGWPQA